MSRIYFVALAVLAATSGCSRTASSHAVSKRESYVHPVPTPISVRVAQSPTTEITAPTCPSQKFSEFIKVFAEDIATQKSFIRYPYAMTVYDPENLEADPKVLRLSSSQVNFPIILAQKNMLAHGVNMHVMQKTPNWYEVSTQSVGSGAYTMTFNFHYQEKCWFLTDSVDAST